MDSFINSKGSPDLVRPEARPSIAVTEGRVAPGGRVQRVLVVEDNADSAKSLSMILRIWGHDAAVALTGDEAIDLAREFKPDVVLLDLGLPDVDGYTVARALRDDPWLSGSTLLAMTGHDGDVIQRKVRDAGFDRYLLKPLGLDALESLLAELAASLR